MIQRLLASAFAAALFVSVADAVEPADLRPGLVAAYRDTREVEVTRLEPTVALALAKGESAHPKLGALQAAKWKGYVNITRPGKYLFSAIVTNGTLRVIVAGKDVLSGHAVALEGGVLPLEAALTETGSPARVELFWEGPGFIKEPLNGRFLGHLPDERPKSYLADLKEEHGRFLFEELACAKCHRSADNAVAKTLADRTGPNLTDVARRAYAGWIDSWLADPAKHRPHTTMPKLFTDDDRGRAERYAVTSYLVALAGRPLEPYRPPFSVSGEARQSLERGRVLFTVTGCAACHQESKPKAKNEEDDREPLKPEDHFYSLGTSGPAAKYLLGAPGSKTRPEAMAMYLQDPLKTNPAGRMPHMVLNVQEANDIARYLCRLTDEATEPGMPAEPKLAPEEIGKRIYREHFGDTAEDQTAALGKLTRDKQWVEVGRTLMDVKGCINCHTVEEKGQVRLARESFPKREALQSGGCLAAKPEAKTVPVYKLDAREAAALAAFLKTGLTGAGRPAPAYNARVALRRFNCLNCHARDGEGGIASDLTDQMRLLEKAENADDIRPPLLTGVGHKSRTSWLKSVLTDRGRARPWMQLRMPQYGEANVAALPEALASLEGTLPDDAVHKVALNADKIQLGKQIVGKGGLGCISCHDIGGVANTGTRGPDLATINQRVRFEWYDRWMHQPLRMAPGTRMPQAFVDGKSTLSTVLNGDPQAQGEAMWAYLSLGPGLPLPDGLEPPRGLIVAVKDRPEVLRTFLPDAGSKAIAVGYPGGVNLAFSADQARIAYAWGGNFLDASPVWNNRGGAPAKLLGPKFWIAPPSHPWGLTANAKLPPDFVARANNPAFGAPLPLEPARIYDGPMAVRFDGYSLDKLGRPTFRYSLDESGRGAVLKVSETPSPIKSAIATGLARQFALESPSGYTAWLLAGQTNKSPRVLGDAALDLKAEEPLARASGVRVVLPQDGDRAVVLEARNAPEGSSWRFVPKAGGGWLAVLRLPESKTGWKGMFELVTWAVPKDDDALLKDLPAK